MMKFLYIFAIALIASTPACSRKQQPKREENPQPTPSVSSDDDQSVSQGDDDPFGQDDQDDDGSLSDSGDDPDPNVNTGLPQASFVLASGNSPGKDRVRISWINTSNILPTPSPTYQIVYKQTGSVNGEFMFLPKVIVQFHMTGKAKPCKVIADNVDAVEKTFATACED